MRTSALSDASMLDDGAVIINARRPVARIAIPLGAHQDATKDRKEGRSWRSLRRAPKATIKDRTFEASAVRADGSHHPARKSSGEVKLVMPKVGQMPDVHMPHVH